MTSLRSGRARAPEEVVEDPQARRLDGFVVRRSARRLRQQTGCVKPARRGHVTVSMVHVFIWWASLPLSTERFMHPVRARKCADRFPRCQECLIFNVAPQTFRLAAALLLVEAALLRSLRRPRRRSLAAYLRRGAQLLENPFGRELAVSQL
jgi:hypothetical protein